MTEIETSVAWFLLSLVVVIIFYVVPMMVRISWTDTFPITSWRDFVPFMRKHLK